MLYCNIDLVVTVLFGYLRLIIEANVAEILMFTAMKVFSEHVNNQIETCITIQFFQNNVQHVTQ